MRIKEVEELVGISKKNIRFYEKENLLKPGREMENSYRDYTDEDVTRLKQIKLLRKLDMPISEIKSIFDGKASLTTAVKRHAVTIAEHQKSLQQSLSICEKISSDGKQLAQLDIDEYLSGLEKMEKEGTMFSNIVKKDVMRKYFGPVITAAVIIIVVLGLIIGFIALNESVNAPWLIIAYFAVVFAVLVIGTIFALISRIKEIRSGEENDLSNY